MEAIQEKKLECDKSEWKPVRFGDVVREPKESIKDPETAGVEYVLGLEHIEPEDIHLRSFNTLEDSTTFTKAFKKGDVLFGRRRAYLKKAARAEFDGICSGDITVFRAKENLLPELLPFIVNNDKFFDWAVKHSAGGLSPRVKFKDLAKYEFLLPPKDQQAQLAELLWSLDEVIEKNKRILDQNKVLRKSYLQKFQRPKKDWKGFKVKDLMELHYGKALKESNRTAGDFPVVSSSGIQGKHNEYLVEGPGIVIGRKGNVGQVTWIENNFWVIDTAYFVTINETFSPLPLKFFYYLLISINFQKYSIATAVPGLNRDDALLSKMYLPKYEEIKNLTSKLEAIDNLNLDLEIELNNSKSVQKSLINQIF